MSRPPEVVWTEDGPRSARFDDIYYAPDGLAEARAVFLEGCDLPGAWAGRARFTVAELGFGTGLNILALLLLWRQTRPPGGRLHVFSVEAHPLSAEEAARALEAFPEIADLAARLLPLWPGRAHGFERVELPELGVTLDVATAEAGEALGAWDGAADAWFLDGFAPSRNPEMWRPEVLDLVAARSAPGARLATFTVAGAVRRGLAERGFHVRRAAGHGRKKDRLEATYAGTAHERGVQRVAVVGGGIAGAALARALTRLGAEPLIIEPEPGGGASGNPSALVSPRLDVGDSPVAGLAAQAFARAVDIYMSDGGRAVLAQGVARLAAGPKDVRRFERLARSDLFRPDSFEVLSDLGTEERVGCSGASLWMRGGLALDPQAVVEDWLSDAQVIRWEAASTLRTDAGWRVLDRAGAVLAEADAVCLAAGAGLSRWLTEIEPVLGQASWTRAADPPGAPASWGGYLSPLPGGGVLFGATHDRGVSTALASPEGDRRNLAALAKRFPALATRLRGVQLESRASVRASTPDRLPVAGEIEPGLFVLGGFGGRGFTWAPLLGEHVAAQATGAPSPLPRESAALLDPGRFQARAQRGRLSR